MTSVPPVTVTDTLLPPTASPTTPSLPSTPTTAGLSLAVLRNGTYHTPAFGKTFTLVNGSYSNTTATGTYTVQMLDTYALGDLNGDGLDDAAIILAENDGGTGLFESVIAVFNEGASPVQASESLLGDRVQVDSMNISSNVIHLGLHVQGPNDPMCCPSLVQNRSYWVISGKLWLMRVTSTIGGSEHSITINSPANWADVTSPFTVTGSMPISPFENTLAYRIYLPDETKVNEYSLLVNSAGMGTPGTFSHDVNLSMAGITGPVIIQFVEVSMADGSTIALGSVIVNIH